MPNLANLNAPQTILMLRVPLVSSSVYYRAYAEPLLDGTVLDWALTRFLRSVPPHVSLACVAESDYERDRLAEAYSGTANVLFVRVSGRGETDHCRCLMDAQQVSRLLVARLSHAVAPLSIMRDILVYHDTLGADLTEVTMPGSTASMFLVESSLINILLDATLSNMPSDVLAAATLLREARARGTYVARAYSWSRLNGSLLSKTQPKEWPEGLALESSADVNTLRGALDLTAEVHDANGSFVAAWKQSAIAAQKDGAAPLGSLDTDAARGRSDSRVRILYVCGLSSFVGAAQSLCHLLDGVDLRRYEPVALVSFSGQLTDELERRGVTVICPNMSITSNTIQNLKFIQRVVRDVSPDIVHGNHEIGMPLISVLACTRTPLVQHVRIRSVESLAKEIHAADVVIAVSQFVYQHIAKLDVDLSKVEVILNGVNQAHFRPAPLSKVPSRDRIGIPRDEFVIVVIARFVPYKRHDVAIKAVGKLRDMTGRGHLLLVGELESNRTYGTEVLKWIEQAGLSRHWSHVEFTADVPALLHASDALALPSRDDALPRVVLEAMAVGLPVIVSNTGGVPEVLEHRRNGYIVPHGDPEAVAAVLRELVVQPETATVVGSAAIETIHSSLTARHCAEKTMCLYERTLSDRRSL